MLRFYVFFICIVFSSILQAQDIGEQLIDAATRGARLKQAGEIGMAKFVLDSAINVAKERKQSYHQANLTYHLGLTYMVNAEFEEGQKKLRTAYELFKSLDGRQNHMAGSSLMNAGDVMREQGRMEEAQNYISEGIEYLSSNLVTRRDSNMLVNLHNRRSDIFRLTGDYDRAKQAIYDAPFWPGISYTTYYTNLANAFKYEGKYLDSAEYYYRLDLEQELGYKKPLLRALANKQGNLGRLYILQRRYKEAFPLLISSLNNYSSIQHPDTTNSLVSLVELELGRQNIRQAENFLLRAESGINSFTDEEILESFYNVKRDVAALTDDAEGYRFYLNKADSLSRKKFQEDRLKLVTLDNELEQSKLRQANAEQQAVALRRRNANILMGVGLVFLAGLVYYFFYVSRKMQALSARNELLVREQNHRVKNNLQMINSLLSLQAGRLKDEQSKDVLKRSQTRIQAISLLNRSLYEQQDISHVNLKDYIEELTHDVINSVTDQEVDSTVIIDTIEINIDKATSLGLIINELVVNSIKHAFNNQPGFDLSLKYGEKGLLLHYKDHNEDFVLAEYKGSRSFGKRLIELQSRQLKGELEIFDQSHFELKLVFTL